MPETEGLPIQTILFGTNPLSDRYWNDIMWTRPNQLSLLSLRTVRDFPAFKKQKVIYHYPVHATNRNRWRLTFYVTFCLSPSTLLWTSIGIRILHTQTDRCSPVSRRFIPAHLTHMLQAEVRWQVVPPVWDINSLKCSRDIWVCSSNPLYSVIFSSMK